MVSSNGSTIKFIPKKKREDNRLKDLSEQHKREQDREAELRKRRRDFQRQAEEDRKKSSRHVDYSEKKAARSPSPIREEPLLVGKDQSALASLDLLSMQDERSAENIEKEREREKEIIKRQYLGKAEIRKRVIKPSEKFRNIFNFEWNEQDDTARDETNDLYAHRLEPQLLFGRGFRGGIDVREQKKQNDFYEKLAKKREERGVVELDEVEKRRREQVALSGGMSYRERMLDLSHRETDSGHWTKKPLEKLTERDWRIFREDQQIFIKGGRCPKPFRVWSESGLEKELIAAIDKAGYSKPTPVQMQAIPIGLECRDLIAIAITGSGKTAAFMFPMLTYVRKLPPLTMASAHDGPYGLVLAPSRELATQIEQEALKFASFCPNVGIVSLVGGKSVQEQTIKLQQGVEIVIATPGRLADSLDSSHTVLNQCNYVVLDEADRLVDPTTGFESYIHRILDAIPSTNMKSADEDEVLMQELEGKAGHRRFRITQMFSATMPYGVEKIARKYLRCPSFISIGDPGAGKQDITQMVYWVDEAQKRKRLKALVRETEGPIIIFVNIKKAVDVMGRMLESEGWSVSTLHSGKMQDQREKMMEQFKAGLTDILVATDVAGRGIDVENVKHVINFDMPRDIQTYTHRIGRTGRAGKKGLASSFLTKEDECIMYDLRQFLLQHKQIIPQELDHCPASKIKPGTAVDQKTKRAVTLAD